SWTLGLNFKPEAAPGLGIGVSYFDIRYSDRIAAGLGLASTAFARPEVAGLITRAPTAALVNSLVAGATRFRDFSGGTYTPSTLYAVLDNRLRTLSAVEVSGFDADISYETAVGPGVVRTEFAASHIADFTSKVLPAAPEADIVDTLTNPTAWKIRATS